MYKHYNIKVCGRVQGVFFRVSTQQEAIRLGLHGFVRNEPDGSVYLEVEGEEKPLATLLTWIRLGGPPRGEVDDIDVEEGSLVNFTGFAIR